MEKEKKDVLMKVLRGKCLRTMKWQEKCEKQGIPRGTFFGLRRELKKEGKITFYNIKKTTFNWSSEETESLRKEGLLPRAYEIVELEKADLPLRIEHTKKIKELVIKPWIKEIDKIWICSAYGIVDWRNKERTPTFKELRLNIFMKASFWFDVEREQLFSDFRNHLKLGLNPFKELKKFKTEVESFEERRYRMYGLVSSEIERELNDIFALISPHLVACMIEWLVFGFTSPSAEAIVEKMPEFVRESDLPQRFQNFTKALLRMTRMLPPEKRATPSVLWKSLKNMEKLFSIEVRDKECYMHLSFTPEHIKIHIKIKGLENEMEEFSEFLDMLESSPLSGSAGAVFIGILKEPETHAENIENRIKKILTELMDTLSNDIPELMKMEYELNRELITMKRILEKYERTEVFPGECEYLF